MLRGAQVRDIASVSGRRVDVIVRHDGRR
jgi:hypothetical protein